ncbi:MAG: hypothetical protein K2I12_04800 [Duncaniella sp.]|nr:hypothetical protein [Duncaniella sp.]MDE6465976.1 hypothetical protein [Duncaniella sp.]MDE6572399.1 hypothetical protein [Duncaniella sp.]
MTISRSASVALFLSALILAITTGCNKSSSETDPELELYHIRYSAYAATPTDTINVAYRNPDGSSSRVKRVFPDGKFEVTVGPVIPGFEALIVSSLSIGGQSPTLCIETKRGAEPFVMKARREDAITLKYIVGF